MNADSPQFCVYRLTFLSGAFYIGHTCAGVKCRIYEHLKALRGKYAPRLLQAQWDTYGKFDVDVLEVCAGQDDARRAEVRWIHELNPPLNYVAYKGNMARQRVMLVVRGVEMSLIEAAQLHGVDPKLVHQRVRTYGWTAEQALGLEPRPWAIKRKQREEQATTRRAGKLHEYQGRLWTVSKLSEQFGVPYQRLSSRLRAGWELEEALMKPRLATTPVVSS